MDEHISRLNADADDPSQQPNHGVWPGFSLLLPEELEPYDIAWFEEPVSPDDHAGQAEVRRSTTIAIASGEREFTRFDFQDLLERRALDIAQPDVARTGGMTEIRVFQH
jgi:D-galactarolactone cycloisomerase